MRRFGLLMVLLLLLPAPARADLDDVLRRLQSEDPKVVDAAMRELPAYGEAAAPAVPVLAREIESGGPNLWRAVDALGKLGETAAPAIPALVGLLPGQHFSWVVKTLGGLGPCALPALRELLKSRLHCGGVAREAACQIARFGPAAREAVPDLMGLLDKGDTAYAAAGALASIGPEGRDALARILRGGNPFERDRAAEGLADMGEPGLEVLLEALAGDDPRARAAAMLVMGWHYPPNAAAPPTSTIPPPPLPPGVPPFERPPGPARTPEATARALEAVLARAGDPDARVRERSLPALYWLDPEAKRCREVFLDALADESIPVRANAALALHWLVPRPEDVPAITAAVKAAYDAIQARFDTHLDGVRVMAHEKVARYGILALGRLGEAARDAAPVLANIFREAGLWPTRGYAGDALGLVGGEAALEALLDVFGSEPERPGPFRARSIAVVALGRLGPAAKAAVPGILETIAGAPWPAGGMHALSCIGAVPPEAIPVLIRVLGRTTPPPPPVLHGGARRPRDYRTWPPYTPPLPYPEAEDPREVAGRMLLALRPASEPALKEALSSDVSGTVLRAADLLYEAGISTDEVRRRLREALSHANVHVRLSAAAGLYSHGGPREQIARAIGEAAVSGQLALHSYRHWPKTGIERLHEVLVGCGEAAVPWLVRVIAKTSDRHEPYAAAELLSMIGAPAVPALAKALDDGPVKVRRPAIHALRSIKEGLLPAVPALLRLLDDMTQYQPEYVNEILARAGPEALPALREFVAAHEGEEHRLARHYANAAIEAIEGK